MPANHQIEEREAHDMIARLKDMKSVIMCEEYKEADIIPLCETFNKEDLIDLLSQPGCDNLRIYLGMDTEDKIRLVLVGVDSNENDLLTNSIILENGKRCPTECPPPSPLND